MRDPPTGFAAVESRQATSAHAPGWRALKRPAELKIDRGANRDVELVEIVSPNVSNVEEEPRSGGRQSRQVA